MSSPIRKREIVEAVRSAMKAELEGILKSAKAAHEAATHEESKAEDPHDTRGLEASYLAGAQLARAENFRRVIAALQFADVREFAPDEAIAVGALIELESSGKRAKYFLVNEGGGISVTGGVQVVNAKSPLGQELIGKCAGDSVEIISAGATREYEILSVS